MPERVTLRKPRFPHCCACCNESANDCLRVVTRRTRRGERERIFLVPYCSLCRGHSERQRTGRIIARLQAFTLAALLASCVAGPYAVALALGAMLLAILWLARRMVQRQMLSLMKPSCSARGLALSVCEHYTSRPGDRRWSFELQNADFAQQLRQANP